MSRDYLVTLDLSLIHPASLRRAARERAYNEGLGVEEWADLRSLAPGIESDLVMLLDPGTLKGCEVNGSECHAYAVRK